jgi:CheY-like chemotaxis protein
MRPVLVVEDHADTRQLIQDLLTAESIPNLGAENGLRALDLLARARPCLILLDLTMPVMDGWRFREEQRRQPEHELANIPVVILSALHDCRDHAKQLGAVDVFEKPVDFDRLMALVHRYCDATEA